MSRPVAGVDIPVARAILEYNMKRSVFISLARDRKRGEEGLISDTPMEFSSYTSKLDYILPNVNLSSQIVRLISLSLWLAMLMNQRVCSARWTWI
jgi:hypothetical protein